MERNLILIYYVEIYIDIYGSQGINVWVNVYIHISSKQNCMTTRKLFEFVV